MSPYSHPLRTSFDLLLPSNQVAFSSGVPTRLALGLFEILGFTECFQQGEQQSSFSILPILVLDLGAGYYPYSLRSLISLLTEACSLGFPFSARGQLILSPLLHLLLLLFLPLFFYHHHHHPLRSSSLRHSIHRWDLLLIKGPPVGDEPINIITVYTLQVKNGCIGGELGAFPSCFFVLLI